MKIVDLAPEHEEIFCQCLEEWSDEIREAGNHKRDWYAKAKDKGLRVKLALDETGTVGGMIQYLPIEQSPASGSGLYFILCVWVHGYKQGRGAQRPSSAHRWNSARSAPATATFSWSGG